MKVENILLVIHYSQKSTVDQPWYLEFLHVVSQFIEMSYRRDYIVEISYYVERNYQYYPKWI